MTQKVKSDNYDINTLNYEILRQNCDMKKSHNYDRKKNLNWNKLTIDKKSKSCLKSQLLNTK